MALKSTAKAIGAEAIRQAEAKAADALEQWLNFGGIFPKILKSKASRVVILPDDLQGLPELVARLLIDLKFPRRSKFDIVGTSPANAPIAAAEKAYDALKSYLPQLAQQLVRSWLLPDVPGALFPTVRFDRFRDAAKLLGIVDEFRKPLEAAPGPSVWGPYKQTIDVLVRSFFTAAMYARTRPQISKPRRRKLSYARLGGRQKRRK